MGSLKIQVQLLRSQLASLKVREVRSDEFSAAEHRV